MTPENFRKARNALGLEQHELARQLGVPRSHVRRLERGWAKQVPAPTAKLMRAFQAGYRPADWPRGGER